jgi:uncharacterized membrane protein YoaK (UPF0700 family)
MVTSDNQNPSLATLLSFNGGYIDTAGFLALHGLFTAHVTGNFVTLGASLVLGTSGAIAKLLALPVFCLVIIATRLLAFRLSARRWPVLRIMLGVKLLLLITAAGFALHFGPFPNGDSIWAIMTGMSLVSAMAIQNAAHRIHLGQMPPTTLMTGTTTQMMIDIADLAHGLPIDTKAPTVARLKRMGQSVFAFAVGCAAAALFYGLAHELCFVVPPALGAVMLVLKVV